MATWMAYAAAVAALLAVGGLALERLCEFAGLPRRFAWLGVLALAIAIPLAASPPERARLPPSGVAGEAETGTIVGPGPGWSGDDATDVRPGDAGRSASPASVAALVAWLLASLFALAALGTVLLRSARARTRWERRRIGDEDVYISRRFGPALVGIARPAVVMPRWVLRLGRNAGVTVVRHEREHARSGDHLVLLCAGLVVVAFPWNPGIWWICLRLRAAIEIDCDRRVIASGIPPDEYGSLLLGIGAGRRTGSVFALAMADSASLLERRLKTMCGGFAPLRTSSAVLLAALAIVSVAAACDLPAPTAIAPAVGQMLRPGSEAPATPPSDIRDRGWKASFDQAPRDRAGGNDHAFERAVGEDGRVLVHGRTERPSLSMSAETAGRNPRVQIDGRTLPGGLRSLLPIMDTLDIVALGYRSFPSPRVRLQTADREGNR